MTTVQIHNNSNADVEIVRFGDKRIDVVLNPKSSSKDQLDASRWRKLMRFVGNPPSYHFYLPGIGLMESQEQFEKEIDKL